MRGILRGLVLTLTLSTGIWRDGVRAGLDSVRSGSGHVGGTPRCERHASHHGAVAPHRAPGPKDRAHVRTRSYERAKRRSPTNYDSHDHS